MCIIIVFLKCFKLLKWSDNTYLPDSKSLLAKEILPFAAANSSIARTMGRRLKTIGLMRKHATKN